MASYDQSNELFKVSTKNGVMYSRLETNVAPYAGVPQQRDDVLLRLVG